MDEISLLCCLALQGATLNGGSESGGDFPGVSPDSENALQLRFNGLYVPTVTTTSLQLSEDSNNVLTLKDGFLYLDFNDMQSLIGDIHTILESIVEVND